MASHRNLYETEIAPGYFVGCVMSDFTHADFDEADADTEVAITGVPTDAVAIGGKVRVGELVAGAGPVTAATVSLGDTGDVDALMVAEDVFGATEGSALLGTQGAQAMLDATPATSGASFSPVCNLILTGGNTEDTTAGAWTTFIWYKRFAKPTL